jgi:RNA polymerase sigma-70 factor (ECF subfamily)
MPHNIPHLVKQWLQGDDDAFRPLFTYYYAGVKKYVLRCIKNDSWAEDIAIEVLARLWEKRQVIQEETFENYLFTIARNKIINHWERRIDILLSLDLPEAEMAAGTTSFNPLLQKELEKVYREGVAEMPEQRRTVFLLHRNEQLNYKQIAARLNISPKTVESQMTSALKHLRAAMLRYLACFL